MGPDQEHLARGNHLLEIGEPALAAQSFRCALQLRADSATAIKLGDSLLAAQDPYEAAEAFEIASKLAATDPAPCLLRGHALLATGAIVDAIKAYEEAIRKDSTYAAARYYLAQALVHSGDIVRASGQLHYLLHQEPTYAPAMVLLGDIAFQHGDHRQAAVEYCRAIAEDPVGPEILERLGRAFTAIGDPLQAIKAFDAALSADQSLGQVALAAAQVCEEAGWLSRALRYYRTAAMLPDGGLNASEGAARVEARRLAADSHKEPSLTPSGPFIPPQTFARPSGPAPGTRTSPFNMVEGDHRNRATRPLTYTPFRETQPLDPPHPARAPQPAPQTPPPASFAALSLKALKARGLSVLKDLSNLLGTRPTGKDR